MGNRDGIEKTRCQGQRSLRSQPTARTLQLIMLARQQVAWDCVAVFGHSGAVGVVELAAEMAGSVPAGGHDAALDTVLHHRDRRDSLVDLQRVPCYRRLPGAGLGFEGAAESWRWDGESSRAIHKRIGSSQ